MAAWALWALAVGGVAIFAWLDQLLRHAAHPELIVLTPVSIPPVLGAVSTATVGAVVATRRSRHPVGWLLLTFGLSLSAAGVALAYANYGVARLGTPPGLHLVSLLLPATIVTAIACNALVLMLTPTGSLPSARWRWLVGVTVATPVTLVLLVAIFPTPSDRVARAVDSPLDLHAFEGGLLVAYQAAFAITVIANVAAAASLIVRFRRARGIERQQLRWVALATLLVTLLSVVNLVALVLGAYALAPVVGGLNPPILSAAIGAAILRYRLYDLDRIISRTLAYGLLTVLLGGGYAMVVLGLSQFFDPGSRLVVAAATMLVAAVFQPARRHIQQLVDRRFNRPRYDAAQTIAAFNHWLRRELDVDTLSTEVHAVVAKTMQPTHVSVWLRHPPKASHDQRNTDVPPVVEVSCVVTDDGIDMPSGNPPAHHRS